MLDEVGRVAATVLSAVVMMLCLLGVLMRRW